MKRNCFSIIILWLVATIASAEMPLQTNSSPNQIVYPPNTVPVSSAESPISPTIVDENGSLKVIRKESAPIETKAAPIVTVPNSPASGQSVAPSAAPRPTILPALEHNMPTSPAYGVMPQRPPAPSVQGGHVPANPSPDTQFPASTGVTNPSSGTTDEASVPSQPVPPAINAQTISTPNPSVVVPQPPAMVGGVSVPINPNGGPSHTPPPGATFSSPGIYQAPIVPQPAPSGGNNVIPQNPSVPNPSRVVPRQAPLPNGVQVPMNSGGGAQLPSPNGASFPSPGIYPAQIPNQ
jgi:hypothetical protein